MARDPRPQMRVVMPEVRNASTALALASVVMSVIWHVLLTTTGVSLYLVPSLVFPGLQLWQPITWLLVSDDAMGVLFNALILWSIGGSMERRWGRNRFLRFVFGVTFTAGLLSVAASMALEVNGKFLGGSAMASMIWVAWGLVIWDEQTNLFGFPISGRTFAMIGLLLPMMFAVFGGAPARVALMPTFIAIALAFVLIRAGWSPSELWLRFQSARLHRDLKKRSSKLSVISGGARNMPKDSDKYLH
jgi:membrane associated rhomboid family serine protease